MDEVVDVVAADHAELPVETYRTRGYRCTDSVEMAGVRPSPDALHRFEAVPADGDAAPSLAERPAGGGRGRTLGTFRDYSAWRDGAGAGPSIRSRQGTYPSSCSRRRPWSCRRSSAPSA